MITLAAKKKTSRKAKGKPIKRKVAARKSETRKPSKPEIAKKLAAALPREIRVPKTFSHKAIDKFLREHSREEVLAVVDRFRSVKRAEAFVAAVQAHTDRQVEEAIAADRKARSERLAWLKENREKRKASGRRPIDRGIIAPELAVKIRGQLVHALPQEYLHADGTIAKSPSRLRHVPEAESIWNAIDAAMDREDIDEDFDLHEYMEYIAELYDVDVHEAYNLYYSP